MVIGSLSIDAGFEDAADAFEASFHMVEVDPVAVFEFDEEDIAWPESAEGVVAALPVQALNTMVRNATHSEKEADLQVFGTKDYLFGLLEEEDEVDGSHPEDAEGNESTGEVGQAVENIPSQAGENAEAEGINKEGAIQVATAVGIGMRRGNGLLGMGWLGSRTGSMGFHEGRNCRLCGQRATRNR